MSAELLQSSKIDLLLKVTRSSKTVRIKRHKKKLGTSIDERLESTNDRSVFGH